MAKVTLAKFWSPEDIVYPPGAVVEVDEATAQWLESCGAVADPSAEKPEPKPDPKPTVVPEEKTTTSAKPAGDMPRPARAASIDEWRKYAEAQGIVTKGLSKKDIIAATR